MAFLGFTRQRIAAVATRKQSTIRKFQTVPCKVALAVDDVLHPLKGRGVDQRLMDALEHLACAFQADETHIERVAKKACHAIETERPTIGSSQAVSLKLDCEGGVRVALGGVKLECRGYKGPF